MIETHLAGVDLNLLLVLQVLLEERSVTRAARRLGRTQPAVSRSLAHLREILGDPLFVREGGHLAPTPRAEALAPPLRQILQDIDARVLSADRFDPALVRRTFSVAAADYADAIFLPPLVEALGREAPGVDLVCFPASRPPVEVAEQADLVFGPIPDEGSLRSRLLGEDPFVVLVREGHPAISSAIDLDAYCEALHVLVAPRNTPGGTVDMALAALGRKRRVALRVPSFLVAPLIVAGTDLVLTCPRRLATMMARSLPLRVLEPPVALPPFRMALSWLERWHHDPGHAWFRERVHRVVVGG